MTLRGLALIPLLAIVALPGASATAPAPAGLVRVEADRMSMACLYSIVAYGDRRETVAPVLEAALDEVDRIDRLMSHYKPESPLSRLNREAAAGPVATDPELFDFLADAIHYSVESDGAFDITVGPLMKAWGFFRGEGRLPSDAELARVRETIGYQHVILDRDRKTIRFDRAGVSLDLGGIAKGYAVDRAIALLKENGITTALVSAGGSTLYGLGAPPGKQAWDIEIQDPLDERKVAFTLPLKDRALSMSGDSQKSFEIDGVRYGHIMDPRTGRPVQGKLSTIVVTDTGTAADALDNVFFVLGVDPGRALLGALPRTEVILLLPVLQGSTDRPGVREGWLAVRLPGRVARPRATSSSR